VPRDDERAEAFAELAKILDSDEARSLLAPTQSGFLTVYQPVIRQDLGFHFDDWLVAASALLDRLPPEQAHAVVNEQVILHVEPGSRSYRSQLPLLGRHLPDDLRRKAMGFIYDGLKWPGNEPEKHAALLRRFTPLSDNEVAQAFDHAQANPWSDACFAVADVLAPHLADDLLSDVLKLVMAFPLEKECFAALAGLGRFQPAETRVQTAGRGLAMAMSISHARSRANAVAALAPLLTRPELAAEAFTVLWSVDPFWGVRAMEEMADVLPTELLQAVPGRIKGWTMPDPALDIPRILKRLAAAGYTTVIDDLLPDPEGSWDPSGWTKVLTGLTPLLSASKVRRLWHMWRIGGQRLRGHSDAEPLSLLVSRLPASERAAAVDEILAAYTPRTRWTEDDARVLGHLARTASTERLTQAIREMLNAERVVREWVLAALATGLPDTLTEQALQFALSGDDDLACKALARLAPRLSGTLANQAIYRVNEMADEGWKAVALTALARQLPHGDDDRETVLAAAVNGAISWPMQSKLEGVMADLIPQLPEWLRAEAISAAIREVCRDLDSRHAGDKEPDGLGAVLAVLRGPELQALYTQVGKEVRNPQIRARAQAAVIQQAGSGPAGRFLPSGQPLHHDWPGDYDRAMLMGLIAAAAWWIDQNSHGAAVAEVIEAIFDVARWWP
jgi:hypothetical protein